MLHFMGLLDQLLDDLFKKKTFVAYGKQVLEQRVLSIQFL